MACVEPIYKETFFVDEHVQGGILHIYEHTFSLNILSSNLR